VGAAEKTAWVAFEGIVEDTKRGREEGYMVVFEGGGRLAVEIDSSCIWIKRPHQLA